MKTKIINFDRITKSQFKKLSIAIKSGAVIICPTDTIYGISGNACSKEVTTKICRIKKRSKKKSFIILTHSIESVKKFAFFNKIAKKLARIFWPGPLTMILHSKTKSFGKKIAVRIPAHKKLLQFLKFIGLPLISTSANLSGKSHINRKAELIETFNGKVDYILLNKIMPKHSLPSTIVDTTCKKVKILRQGLISEEKILSCLYTGD